MADGRDILVGIHGTLQVDVDSVDDSTDFDDLIPTFLQGIIGVVSPPFQMLDFVSSPKQGVIFSKFQRETIDETEDHHHLKVQILYICQLAIISVHEAYHLVLIDE